MKIYNKLHEQLSVIYAYTNYPVIFIKYKYQGIRIHAAAITHNLICI